MRHLIALALLASPLFAAAAQSGTVSPGMSRAKVVAALGEPVTARDASEYTYLFYRNDCGRACGMNDLVVLRRDSVVDAIFRSPSRHYTGTSSSPEPIAHVAARTRTPRRSRTPRVVAEKPAPVVAPAAQAKVEPPKPVPAKPVPAKPAPVVAPKAPAVAPKSPAAAPAPASPMKPAAPNDTRPSIPAGEPAARKATNVTPIKPITP